VANVRRGAGTLWIRQINEELDDRLTDAPSDGSEYVRKNGDWAVATGGGGGVDTSGTPVANDFARFTDADTIEGRSYAEVRADLGLEIGTDVQAYDANMISWPATVSATEVGYLNGVTSAIQTQLDGKSGTSHTHAAFASYPGVFSDSGSQSVTSTEATLEFDTEDLDPDTNYALSGGEITVTTGGYFHVSVNIPIDDVDATGGTRAAVWAFVQRDQGSGTWTSDARTRLRGQDYARETSGGEGVNFSGIVQLADGEALRVRIDQSGTTNIATETGQASLSIHRIRAT